MLLFRSPTLYRVIRKLKIRNYRRGWSDCSDEKDQIIQKMKDENKKLIDIAAKDKKELYESFEREKNDLKEYHKKELKNLNDESERAKSQLLQKHNLIIQKKEKERLDQIDYMKKEASRRIDEIRKIAEDDIIKANERESEYQGLINRLKTLFHEASIKFLVTAGEQESLMSSLSKTVHRKNEFMRLSEEFDKMMKDNSKIVKGTRIKQITDNEKNL